MKDYRLLSNLVNRHREAHLIEEFLTLLAICHTVIPTFPECKNTDLEHEHGVDDICGPVEFHSASPDETALVTAAMENQYFCFVC